MSNIKFLVAEKCKPCQLYRRMCDKYRDTCFSQMFTNGLYMSLSRKEIERHWQLPVKKVMLTVFWKMKRSITTDFLENDATINNDSYCQLQRKCLPYSLSIYIYRRRKWTRRHEFKSWPRLIAFHILLGKVWIQLFSLQLWVNSRVH